MAENGYAKPVLVTTEWLAEHLNDDEVVVAEVDEDPDLYEEGHIPSAIKLPWRADESGRRRGQAPGVRGRPDRATRLRAGGCSGRGPHPDGEVDPVGAGRPRRWDVQAARRAAGALRGQGRHSREGSHGLLPDRR